MPKVNKEKVLDNVKRFARKKALVICYLKHVLVFEEHSSEDYLKVISDGKKDQKILMQFFLCGKISML